MQPDEQSKTQPGTVFNPQTDPQPTPPPDLEPDPAPPDDPAPEPSSTPVVTPAEPQVQGPEPTTAEPIDQPILAWQASEYVHHDKRAGWYVLFFLAIAVLIGLAVITHQWLTIGVFAMMAVALMIYANKQPRVLNYSLGDGGITIETKFYPYATFKSFGVIQDVAWHLIDLEPMRRFMPRLNILFEDDKRDQIIDLLTQHLPRHDRQPDMIERAARYLHF